MSGKFILYATVMFVGAALGFLASYQLAGSTPAVATPQPLSERAEAALGSASASGANFTLPNIDGSESQFTDWDGKPRLVNFWATWCAPCRKEIPLLIEMQQAQQLPGLQVIGLAYDERDAVADYAREFGINYPILYGDLGVVEAAEQFDIELFALPFTLAVSSDGELINAHLGELTPDDAQTLLAVMARLENGELSIDEARTALSK